MGSNSRLSRPDAADPPSSTERRELTLSELAHELNSLLDGSLRCVGLARRLLDQPHPADPPSVEHALNKLNLAQDTMRHMAAVISRAMSSKTDVLGLLCNHELIAECVDRISRCLEPAAEQAGVVLAVEIDPDAGRLPTGPLEPVMLNGLRNAIEACAAAETAKRRVELSISLKQRNDLLIIISDNGPGLAPDAKTSSSANRGGHGIGLDLSRRIIESLGGVFEVLNVPFGQGAVFKARIPVENLSTSRRMHSS